MGTFISGLNASSNFSNADEFIVDQENETVKMSLGQLKHHVKASVNSIDELKNVEITDDKYFINVLGYYEPGDGGGGQFYWDADATIIDPLTVRNNNPGTEIIDPDNGGTVIEANSGSGNGRWRRIHNKGSINVKWFGAKGDGINNDAPAIQEAMDHLYKLQAPSINDDGTINPAVLGAADQNWSSGRLYFPVGFYSIEETIHCNVFLIDIYADVKGTGEAGGGTTILYNGDKGTIDDPVFMFDFWTRRRNTELRYDPAPSLLEDDITQLKEQLRHQRINIRGLSFKAPSWKTDPNSTDPYKRAKDENGNFISVFNPRGNPKTEFSYISAIRNRQAAFVDINNCAFTALYDGIVDAGVSLFYNIRACLFFSLERDGIVSPTKPKDFSTTFWIQNCEFANIGRYAIWLSSLVGAANIIRDCSIEACGIFGAFQNHPEHYWQGIPASMLLMNNGAGTLVSNCRSEANFARHVCHLDGGSLVKFENNSWDTRPINNFYSYLRDENNNITHIVLKTKTFGIVSNVNYPEIETQFQVSETVEQVVGGNTYIGVVESITDDEITIATSDAFDPLNMNDTYPVVGQTTDATYKARDLTLSSGIAWTRSLYPNASAQIKMYERGYLDINDVDNSTTEAYTVTLWDPYRVIPQEVTFNISTPNASRNPTKMSIQGGENSLLLYGPDLTSPTYANEFNCISLKIKSFKTFLHAETREIDYRSLTVGKHKESFGAGNTASVPVGNEPFYGWEFGNESLSNFNYGHGVFIGNAGSTPGDHPQNTFSKVGTHYTRSNGIWYVNGRTDFSDHKGFNGWANNSQCSQPASTSDNDMKNQVLLYSKVDDNVDDQRYYEGVVSKSRIIRYEKSGPPASNEYPKSGALKISTRPYYLKGDIFYNTNPTDHVGWICTIDGTEGAAGGTWEKFGFTETGITNLLQQP